MKKLGILVLLSFSISALSQEKQKTATDHKWQFSLAYSNLRVGGFFGQGELFAEGNKDELDPGDISGLYGPPSIESNPQNVFPLRALVNRGRKNAQHLHGLSIMIERKLSRYIGLKLDLSAYSRSADVKHGGLILSAPYRNNMLLPLATSYEAGSVRSIIVIPGGAYPAKQQFLSLSAGISFRDYQRTSKLKPYGFMQAGLAIQSIHFAEFSQRDQVIYGNTSYRNTGILLAAGGGTDLSINKNLGIRLQLGYYPARIREYDVLSFKQPLTNMGFADNQTFHNLSTATLYSNNEITIQARWQHNFKIAAGIVYSFE